MIEILNAARKMQQKLVEYRRYLHANPELSYQEYNTCKYICKCLSDLNIEHKIIANTGVVATIGDGQDCIALRADIDALPINEETGLDFASKNAGVMHACGHDLHVAMLLGAAELIFIHKNRLRRTIKLIFQPAEEVLPGGAIVMIENGVLENPKPSMIFGQHINPTEKSGNIYIAEAAAMASTNELFFTIKGKGSHVGQPHLGNDPITASVNIINFLQVLNTKYKNPLQPAVVSICSIHGGTANNIFPDEVKMSGAMRTYDETLRKHLEHLIISKCSELAQVYDTQCEVKINRGYPAVINDKRAVQIVQNVAENLLGKDSVCGTEPKMWAEDFAYYSQKIPACFWFLGTSADDDKNQAGLHNSCLNPDESVLYKGAALMAQLALHN